MDIRSGIEGAEGEGESEGETDGSSSDESATEYSLSFSGPSDPSEEEEEEKGQRGIEGDGGIEGVEEESEEESDDESSGVHSSAESAFSALMGSLSTCNYTANHKATASLLSSVLYSDNNAPGSREDSDNSCESSEDSDGCDETDNEQERKREREIPPHELDPERAEVTYRDRIVGCTTFRPLLHTASAPSYAQLSYIGELHLGRLLLGACIQATRRNGFTDKASVTAPYSDMDAVWTRSVPLVYVFHRSGADLIKRMQQELERRRVFDTLFLEEMERERERERETEREAERERQALIRENARKDAIIASLMMKLDMQ
ncbi:hypothetical protein KIPB_007912 [Kipferlia bialata]|uniref:Uncharacterized protein n=1 Tax=Kipferlia bialata TaxID=797122 RepID=A0A9K3D0Y6_9EUKA|nr:hypothetical protein KIPB_007912 [Kipferlia bialata]|eukprot:g7912.t1